MKDIRVSNRISDTMAIIHSCWAENWERRRSARVLKTCLYVYVYLYAYDCEGNRVRYEEKLRLRVSGCRKRKWELKEKNFCSRKKTKTKEKVQDKEENKKTRSKRKKDDWKYGENKQHEEANGKGTEANTRKKTKQNNKSNLSLHIPDQEASYLTSHPGASWRAPNVKVPGFSLTPRSERSRISQAGTHDPRSSPSHAYLLHHEYRAPFFGQPDSHFPTSNWLRNCFPRPHSPLAL